MQMQPDTVLGDPQLHAYFLLSSLEASHMLARDTLLLWSCSCLHLRTSCSYQIAQRKSAGEHRLAPRAPSFAWKPFSLLSFVSLACMKGLITAVLNNIGTASQVEKVFSTKTLHCLQEAIQHCTTLISQV